MGPFERTFKHASVSKVGTLIAHLASEWRTGMLCLGIQSSLVGVQSFPVLSKRALNTSIVSFCRERAFEAKTGGFERNEENEQKPRRRARSGPLRTFCEFDGVAAEASYLQPKCLSR